MEDLGLVFFSLKMASVAAALIVAFENLWAATVVSHHAEDGITGMETAASARNMYEARIESLQRTGPDVTLRCALPEGAMLARLTPQALQALGLAVGGRVFLAIKSHSVRALTASRFGLARGRLHRGPGEHYTG